jgi:regulatory factor X 1/2/3
MPSKLIFAIISEDCNAYFLPPLPLPPSSYTQPHRTTQFGTQYAQDVSVLSNTSISAAQATMMGGLPHTVVPSTAYYETHHLSGQSLGHLEMGPSGHSSMAHTTRAHPETIQWLLENYETAEGVSLPRSTLYNHYLRHCAANKIDAVNAASFGKLIRSVFIGLKTRRLGTRYVYVCMCVCVHELQVPVCLVILCV